MNMSIENNMLRLLCQTISVRPVKCFFGFPLPLNTFKVQSAGTGVNPLDVIRAGAAPRGAEGTVPLLLTKVIIFLSKTDEKKIWGYGVTSPTM